LTTFEAGDEWDIGRNSGMILVGNRSFKEIGVGGEAYFVFMLIDHRNALSIRQ